MYELMRYCESSIVIQWYPTWVIILGYFSTVFKGGLQAMYSLKSNEILIIQWQERTGVFPKHTSVNNQGQTKIVDMQSGWQVEFTAQCLNTARQLSTDPLITSHWKHVKYASSFIWGVKIDILATLTWPKLYIWGLRNDSKAASTLTDLPRAQTRQNCRMKPTFDRLERALRATIHCQHPEQCCSGSMPLQRLWCNSCDALKDAYEQEQPGNGRPQIPPPCTPLTLA